MKKRKVFNSDFAKQAIKKYTKIINILTCVNYIGVNGLTHDNFAGNNFTTVKGGMGTNHTTTDMTQTSITHYHNRSAITWV